LLVATLPLWMVLLNGIWPGGSRPNLAEIAGLVVGFTGVFVLVDPIGLFSRAAPDHDSIAQPAAPVDRLGAAALVLASLCWAIGSLWSRRAKLPKQPLLATGMEMLTGGAALLLVGLLCGEWQRVRPSAFSVPSLIAFAYLVVFGSFIGFSAYIWLLRVTTPARVSTYAYVNPVVAVVLGWAVLDERLRWTTFLAMGLILAAVLLISAFGTRRPVPQPERTVTSRNDSSPASAGAGPLPTQACCDQS
jgi:drug/metabolite transporter (DMT)-like permease